jgi:hypothetical protein
MGNRPDGVMRLIKDRNAAGDVFLPGQGDTFRYVHVVQSSAHIGQRGDDQPAGLIGYVAGILGKLAVCCHFFDQFVKHYSKGQRNFS